MSHWKIARDMYKIKTRDPTLCIITVCIYSDLANIALRLLLSYVWYILDINIFYLEP